jgi:hypothetical protein
VASGAGLVFPDNRNATGYRHLLFCLKKVGYRDKTMRLYMGSKTIGGKLDKNLLDIVEDRELFKFICFNLFEIFI